MSKEIRSEKDRRIAELEALVAGQAGEIKRLNKELDKCERAAAALALAIQKERSKRVQAD